MSALNPAFFLGRAELLGWINDTLGLRLAKLEDTCSGAIACQLMDALHGGTVPLKKVDFNAKDEYTMINNYKVLQEMFSRHNVDKYVEVSKLIKGKPLDNIEFMQWFKMHFDSVTNGHPITDYDGPGRRAQSKTGDMKAQNGPAAGLHKTKLLQDTSKAAQPAALKKPAGATAAAPRPAVASHPSSDMEQLTAQLNEARLRASDLEKEKDFYYSKLRDIELLCQTPALKEQEVLQRVEAILYAPTAEEGRQLLIQAQTDLAGGVYLEEDQEAQGA